MTIRPLCATIVPFSDESLASILVRTAEANSVPRVAELLHHIGLPVLKPAYVAFTRTADTDRLAQALGLSRDDVMHRMHQRIVERPFPTVNWFGTPLERRFIEAETRRVPTDVSSLEHHARSLWMIRPFKARPETGAPFLDACPSCQHRLGWTRATDLRWCEKCDAPLSVSAGRASADDVSILDAIAHLVDPDEARRAQALAALPAPFSGWQGGDVFSAVVDLGVIAQCPNADFNDPTGRQISQGDFAAVSAATLIKGWRVVSGWPATFEDLVETVSQNGAAKSNRWLEMMGPFARHVHRQAPATPFRNLIRAELADLLRLINLPVKRVDKSVLFDRPRSTALTTAEANDRFGICNRTLAKLIPNGRAVLPTKSASRRLTLFDEALLGGAIGAFREMPRLSQVAKATGIPAYVVRALAAEGVLKLCDDPDAQLLAARDLLLDQPSVQELLNRLASLPVGSEATGLASFNEGLRRELNPLVWCGAVRGILDESIAAWRPANQSRSLADLLLSESDLRRAALQHRGRPIPDYDIPAVAVAPLLWTTSPVISAAEAEGLLTRGPNGFRLSEVERFRCLHVFPEEAQSWFDGSAASFVNRMRAAGAEPAAVLHRVNVWLRADVCAAFPESASAEYAY